MSNIKKFTDYFKNKLNEAFVLRDKSIEWDSKESPKNSVIKTSFGKKSLNPYEKTFKVEGSDVKVFSLFGRNANTTTEILKAIKGKIRKLTMTPEANDVLVNRASTYLARLLRNQGKIDCIIPIQSSSPFLRNVVEQAVLKYGGNVPVYYDGIIKTTDISSIYVDTPKLSDPRAVRNLEYIIRKWESNGYVELKDVNVKLRRVVRNWLMLKKELEPKVKYKKVIIIDDILTTGTTIIEAALQCFDNEASEVVAFTLLDN
jgi:hypothetical protein